MTTLHMGVVDMPYAYEQEQATKSGKRILKKKRKVALAITTGEVASILEENYHVYENFFQTHAQEIADIIAKSYKDAFDAVSMGAPEMDPAAEGMTRIEAMFKQYISSREAETNRVPSLSSANASRQVPTQAALDGVNHRLAHPYAKANPRRPSFLDTGLYQSSFKAWVTKND